MVDPDDDGHDLSLGTGLDVSATRALSAFALHLAGATDGQIAKQMGYASASVARAAWQSTLAGSVSMQEREEVRKSEAARLDRMQMAWWNKAIDPKASEQATATRMVLAISERRARLLGLDAPTRVEVYTPTSQEIMDFVNRLRLASGVEDEIEGEIVDVEVIDGPDPG